MTATEERNLKRAIAFVQCTKPMYIDIESINDLGDGAQKVFCKVKGLKLTVLVRGNYVLATMVRV